MSTIFMFTILLCACFVGGMNKTKKKKRRTDVIRSFRMATAELKKLQKIALQRKTNASVVLRDLINTA
jgi:hypothetical protein